MRRALLTVTVFLISCGHQTRTEEAPLLPEPVRITQFYAEAAIAKGEKTNICYGVENATAVRLKPDVEKMWPTVARCFPVAPAQTTTYTLTAEDAQGHTATQSVEIRVGPPRPKIIEVSVNKMEVAPGEMVVVCYKAANAVAVDVAPGRLMTAKSMEHACYSDKPAHTTTYHVKVTGGGGQTDSEQVTVKVAGK